MEHYKHLDEDGIDIGLLSRLGLLPLSNVLGKVFFTTFQILLSVLRPGFVRTLDANVLASISTSSFPSTPSSCGLTAGTRSRTS
jgi:hypothetical protein